ncbi:hypothetical protein F4824DRAFT_502142 [Ustulina deusta]|nr:hypothetical protein F4824DRAFT_502142 [Ustulina deusta]
MLARLYCFLCDFVPRGLRGQFDHIGGDDVMGHMLCSDGDTAPSRHRFSKDAQAAWFELDTSMKKGRDCLLPREEARSTLDVKTGFWKGIRADNLDECFLPKDCGKTGTGMSADYNQLFGADFRRCRQNMKPYLSSWAQSFSLQGEPLIMGDNSGDELEAGIATGPATGPLCQLLDTHAAPAPQELRAWLDGQSTRSCGILRTWYKHWAQQMFNSTSLREQLVIQSLFLQSTRCLRNFYNAEGTVDFVTPEAYMLLDIEDTELRSPQPDEDNNMVRRLDKLADIVAYRRTIAKLADLVRGIEPAQRYIVDVSACRTAFFIHLLRDPEFAQHGLDTIRLDELRVQVIVQSIEKYRLASSSRTIQQSWSEQSLLTDKEAIIALKLTTWQRLLLLIPGQKLSSLLTDEQFLIYQ